MFQAVLFTAGGSALALAVDVESGLLARMRAMPINAAVAIGGRLATDLLRSLASVITVAVLGLVCGAEPDSWVGAAAALGVALAMGEVLALLFCGIALRSAQPVQVANLIQTIEMPLLMLSTAFIPVETPSRERDPAKDRSVPVLPYPQPPTSPKRRSAPATVSDSSGFVAAPRQNHKGHSPHTYGRDLPPKNALSLSALAAKTRIDRSVSSTKIGRASCRERV